jgi:preprotein translocase subunit YajC
MQANPSAWIVIMLVIMVVLYLLVIRPIRRR